MFPWTTEILDTLLSQDQGDPGKASKDEEVNCIDGEKHILHVKESISIAVSAI